MPYDDPQLVHWDSMLTNFSTGFDVDRDPYVGDLLAPTLPVDKQSNRYYVATRDSWGRPTNDERAPGGMANELPPMTLSRRSYFAQEHALVNVVPIEDEENADPSINSLQYSTVQTANTILLNRENEIITKVTDNSNFNAANSIDISGASVVWDDYTTPSTPIPDVKTGRNVIHGFLGTLPNAFIVQWEVASTLEDHPSIIERIKYSQLGVTTDQLISEIFGVKTFVRAGAIALTSDYQLTETVAYMWPKVALLAYVPDRPMPRQPAFMYEFNWPFATNLPAVPGSQLPAGTMPTERWYDIDRKAWKVRVSRRYDLHFITIDDSGLSTGGYLMYNAIT